MEGDWVGSAEGFSVEGGRVGSTDGLVEGEMDGSSLDGGKDGTIDGDAQY